MQWINRGIERDPLNPYKPEILYKLTTLNELCKEIKLLKSHKSQNAKMTATKSSSNVNLQRYFKNTDLLKIAQIIATVKPGKDSTDVKSYRPMISNYF